MGDLGVDILAVVDTVSIDKGVEREVIFEALEAALSAAARKRFEGDADVRVSINREDGTYETFRRWQVMADDDPEFESPQIQMLHSTAQINQPGIEIGDYVEEPIEGVEVGRISAHAAKQVIVQKVREAERAQIAQAYMDKIGDLLIGVVKRVEYLGAYVDLGGNAEGFIPREDMIPREIVRMGDRLRAYLKEVRQEVRGPQLILSRTAPEFLIQLFHLEVPEIEQGLIEVRGAARDPGMRAKIAVHATDPRLDPVGACVGMRGSRVQAVSNELSGERIDIITWHDDPAQYVINAMSLPNVVEIVQDNKNQAMDIAVEEDKLSQAIGRGGQNVRLASQLSGWTLNVMTPQDLREKVEQETRALEEKFQEKLDVDEHVASILVENGFTEVSELAFRTEELLQVEEFNEQIVEELHARAQECLEQSNQGDEDILSVEGMDPDLAMQFALHGITTRRQLAVLALDELPEISELNDEQAGALIMKARENLVMEAPSEDENPPGAGK